VNREREDRLSDSQLQESVDREVQLYRVHGSDYRRSTCETADDSNCQIVNCVDVRASGINSLYAIRREVICRVTYTQHVTFWCDQEPPKRVCK
jgi:hypothetical protein